MNKIILCGRLTREPEYNTTQNGLSVCKFTIAVNRRYEKDTADFFNIVTWRGQADNCKKYLDKGNEVLVSGSVQVRTYEGTNGAKKTAVEIVADEVQFLTPKGESKTKPTPVNTDEQLPF